MSAAICAAMAAREYYRRRDRAICLAFARGERQKAIAEEYELSESRVKAIVAAAREAEKRGAK